MVINLAYLDSILNPLIGGADDDDLCNKYKGIDNNNEKEVKEVIKETIKKKFEKRSEDYKSKAKSALAYALVSKKVDFERLYDRNLLPFEHPDNASLFFIWLWQELFNNESLKLYSHDNYTIIFNNEEPL